MRYWTFDPNTCRFERASKQAALHAADVAVVNDDTDVQVISDHQPPQRWPAVSRWWWRASSSSASCSSRYVYR